MCRRVMAFSIASLYSPNEIVAEMKFILAYVLNVACIFLHCIMLQVAFLLFCRLLLTTVLKRFRLKRGSNTIAFTTRFSFAYCEPFSSPEAALLLVSTKNRNLQEGPTPEVFRKQNWKMLLFSKLQWWDDFTPSLLRSFLHFLLDVWKPGQGKPHKKSQGMLVRKFEFTSERD